MEIFGNFDFNVIFDGDFNSYVRVIVLDLLDILGFEGVLFLGGVVFFLRFF